MASFNLKESELVLCTWYAVPALPFVTCQKSCHYKNSPLAVHGAANVMYRKIYERYQKQTPHHRQQKHHTLSEHVVYGLWSTRIIRSSCSSSIGVLETALIMCVPVCVKTLHILSVLLEAI